MLIDWFTVIAQTANFLILVWLMKRYLYQPILSAIDAREAKIAATLKDTESKKVEATQQRDEFQQKNDSLEKNRNALLQTAQHDAQVERQRLLDQTRKDADALRAKLDAAVQGERDTLKREVATGVRQEVFAIARQVLTELSSACIETQISKVFIDRLHALDGQAKKELTNSLQGSPEPALVRSAFALPEEQRLAIQLALKETLAMEIPIKFETAPRLVCGIELSMRGQKLAWSIDDYLLSLDQRMSEILAPVVKVETEGATKATHVAAVPAQTAELAKAKPDITTTDAT